MGCVCGLAGLFFVGWVGRVCHGESFWVELGCVGKTEPMNIKKIHVIRYGLCHGGLGWTRPTDHIY